jgi:quinoprotein glucose dehydrogenase
MCISAPRLTCILGTLGLCLLILGSLDSLAEERKPAFEPAVAKASGEGQSQIAGLKFPSSWKCELFAAEPMIANPVAFAVTPQGQIFVCESFRQNQGVTDNRSHDKKWQLADLAAQTVQERINYHRSLLAEEAINYEKQVDRIRVLVDMNQDGQADESKIFVSGFNGIEEGTGAGVLVRGKNVYYTCIPKLWLFEDKDHDLKADNQIPMYDGFGVRVAFRGHDMHGLIIGPDGRLYFSIGDRGYHVVTPDGTLSDPESGAVFRCELDGSQLEVYATGLRNPQELAFDDYGTLFTCDNNSDSGDEARWTVVAPGGDSGWRMMYQYLPDRGPFNREKIWQPFHEDSPAYTIPPIANFSDGPSGLVAYPGTGLSEEYRGGFFLCDFRGQSSNSGIRLAKPTAKGAFYELTNDDQPIWNLLATDVDFGVDGSLYVSDWVNGWNGEGKGRIYRFYDPEISKSPLVVDTKVILQSDFQAKDLGDLIKLLSHADRRVRLEAQFELAAREAIELLSETVASSKSFELARIHAIWGLGQISRKGKHSQEAKTTLEKLFATLEAAKELPFEILACVITALSDSKDISEAVQNQISQSIQHSQPRVQYAAALAAGKLQISSAMAHVIPMLEKNSDADPMLRHAGIMTMVGQRKVQDVVALSKHASQSVRLAAVVALRKRNAVEVAEFLNDQSERVCLEAVRAVHDVSLLHSQLDKLASVIVRPTHSLPILHRVLNAHFRLGKLENAKALSIFAADSNRPGKMRLEALEMLGSWENPGILDRVMNRYMPLERRDSKPAAESLDHVLSKLLKSDADVRSKARDVAAELGLQSVSPALVSLVQDKNAPGEERAKSLDSLLRLKSTELPTLVKTYVDDLSPPVRTTSLRLLALFDTNAACEAAKKRVNSEVVTERQAAWDLVGKINLPMAMTILEDGVARLLESRLPQDCWLNVKEAAEGRLNPELKVKLDKYQAAIAMKATENPTAAYQDCLVGGNKANGKTLFFERSQLSCVRCHEVGDDGGEVGPELTDIGVKKNAEYLLEAIIAPNAKLAEGFETIIIQTDDGEIVTGIVKQRDDDKIVVLKSDGSLVSVASDAIEGTKKGQSSMPADLVKYLSRRELRDLVAYLVSLDGSLDKKKKDKNAKGHGQ